MVMLQSPCIKIPLGAGERSSDMQPDRMDSDKWKRYSISGPGPPKTNYRIGSTTGRNRNTRAERLIIDLPRPGTQDVTAWSPRNARPSRSKTAERLSSLPGWAPLQPETRGGASPWKEDTDVLAPAGPPFLLPTSSIGQM